MTRNQKRQRRRKKKQRREARQRPGQQGWTEFSPAVELPEQGEDPGGGMYENSKYCVAIREHDHFVHLVIMNQDHSALHDWRDFQRF